MINPLQEKTAIVTLKIGERTAERDHTGDGQLFLFCCFQSEP